MGVFNELKNFFKKIGNKKYVYEGKVYFGED